MKEKKEAILEKLKDKNLYILLAISLIFFGIFWRVQYATDTYSVFESGTKSIMRHFFSCGRFVTGLAWAVVRGILKIGNNGIYVISYIFAIICTTISLYKMYRLIKKETKNNVVSIILATLIIINPFSLELFLYIEKGILMFSVLMCVMAVEQLDKFFVGNKKSLILVILYMFIANCSYQGTAGLFVAISLIYIIKYSKNIKEFLLNNVLVVFLYGIPAVANYLLMRLLFSNSRVSGEIKLGESIAKITDGVLRIFKDNYGLLPKYLFSVIILCLLVFIVYKSIKSKQKTSEKILNILGAFYIILGTVGVTIAPQLLQNTDSIWFVARSSYPIASIIGILLMYTFMKFEVNNITKNVIIIFLAIFLLIQLNYFMTYAIDGYIVNYEDKQNVSKIIEEIKKYESETGNKIEKIAFYQDKNPNYTYSGIKSTGDINIKALYPEWSAIQIIKFYSQLDLTTVQKDEKIEQEFREKDWDCFDSSQIIFENDVMHLCNY